MKLTPYHAKYFAHELTKRSSSESVDKLTSALSDAQVDLNPHQIEAALFAFRSPLSKGAILADEVGLGKTIEAGILLAQRWAERHRRLLVICPANLRKQWSQELADKFFLPSSILEKKTFNEAIKRGNLNPFQQDSVVICSYHFARSQEPYIRQTEWDLVVIDEAHRLRKLHDAGLEIAAHMADTVPGTRCRRAWGAGCGLGFLSMVWDTTRRSVVNSLEADHPSETCEPAQAAFGCGYIWGYV